MLAARYTQGGSLQFSEVDLPTIGDDQMLLRVEAASICGTDTKIARNGHRRLQPGQTITLGHEFVGTIERVGPRVAGYTEGMRVGVAPNVGCGRCEMCARALYNMCPDYSAFGINFDGAHAAYVAIPAAVIAQGNVVPLPAGIDITAAALAEPLSCAINGIGVCRIQPGETVLIYGAGPMGLLNLLLARLTGAGRLIVVDPVESRRTLARQLGADETLEPAAVRGRIRDTIGRGLDVAIVAAPVPAAAEEAIAMLAPFGRLCLFAGLPKDASTIPVDANLVHYKNLMITGMTGGPPRDYRTALNLIAGKRIDVSRIISHVLPLARMQEAYEIALGGRGMKIVIKG
jgi:L-iditol 2-dehydrogenase